MPKWKTHRKIASKMGIPENLVKEIDQIIDFEGIHDGRGVPEVFVEDARKSYEMGGYKGLEAFFLHHVLDRIAEKLLGERYREVWGKSPRGGDYILTMVIEDSKNWLSLNLRDFEYKNEAKRALDDVVMFVRDNFEEIVKLIERDIE